MKSKLYCKILAVGIIVLFIGVSVVSGFVIEDKTSTELVTIDSENENPNPISGETLENSNCFVIGYDTSITRFTSGSKYNIGFGGYSDWGDDFVSKGSIRTIGLQVKWEYNGKFIGTNGIQTFVDRFDHDVKWYIYIGIKGFRGLVYGGLFGWFCGYRVFTGIFIGRADNVKIMTID